MWEAIAYLEGDMEECLQSPQCSFDQEDTICKHVDDNIELCTYWNKETNKEEDTGAQPAQPKPKAKGKAKATEHGKGTKEKGTTISPSVLKGKLKVGGKEVASKGAVTKSCPGPKHVPVTKALRSSIPTATKQPTIHSDFPLYW